ncbi:helix-turn-helix domain-containing protein [Pantoea ananatis]|uniref:helix-turn-helix domain-containing protein n=1 Tax=Pantoea ananas TaxID=553 RepID=UPI00222117AB|nr:helix-turn-helix domain-containing protein [Pantoea ananatis]
MSEADALVDTDALPALPGVHAGEQGSNGGTAMPLPDADLDSLALGAMRQALDACNGNVSQAARRLGISRSTLYRRLQLGTH